jgi:deoxyribodipyrimidine photo-lyase
MTKNNTKVSIFWFRRDLRLHDNHGLYEALRGELPVLPIFIFDRHILDELDNKSDARVTFIHDELQSISNELRQQGSDLRVFYGFPEEVWNSVLEDYNVGAVYTNRDYEPYAKDRDEKIKVILDEHGIAFHTFKDHVILEKDEVRTGSGDTYTVFTPYSRKWRSVLKGKADAEDLIHSEFLRSYESEGLMSNYVDLGREEIISLEKMGFRRSEIEIPPRLVKQGRIKEYKKTRNFPANREGTSRLGIHFRFGTISIREKARKAAALSSTYLNELIWRDFYSQILDAFPKVVDRPFREKYKFVEWRDDAKGFEAWCEGKTGFPMVDAGMRQLNTTGYMHNRVRMITASFLTKHLLIDWRKGEAYFASKLLDYDLASNNGGWQWAAGCGTDAAPYFRIFNPKSQQEKFDKEFTYIRRWIDEFGTDDYPDPIVDHKEARERCLNAFKKGLALAEEKGY